MFFIISHVCFSPSLHKKKQTALQSFAALCIFCNFAPGKQNAF